MNPIKWTLPGLALGLTLVLIQPGSTSLGYSLLGQQLGTGQRDVRFFNNFTDTESNDSTGEAGMFPGATGLELSLWKGVVEWGSGPHGNGSGDPTQSLLGSGNSNFDALWSGQANGEGGLDDNIVSAISSCTPGLLAFAEGPSDDGWRIRFCDGSVVFDDDPVNTPGGSFDLQSVMVHEYGHVLGLGHSSVPGATMLPTIGAGTESSRSINADDRAGIMTIYGALSASKPIICGTSVNGNLITITGRGFDNFNNTVWFRGASTTNPGIDPRVQLTGLFSSNGGTQIQFVIPGAAAPGDVIVKLSGNGHDRISNAFPTDLTNDIGATCSIQVTQITPAVLPPLSPGNDQNVSLIGSGFSGVTSIALEPGIALSDNSWTIVSDSTITLNLPQALSLGAQTLTLGNAVSSTSINFTIAPNDQPTLQVGSGQPKQTLNNGELLTIVLAGKVGSIQRLYYSASSIPSTLPVVQFSMGNNFTQLLLGPTVTVGLSGFTTISMPLSYAGIPMTFYAQCVDLSAGPSPQYMLSNLQCIMLAP